MLKKNNEATLQKNAIGKESSLLAYFKSGGGGVLIALVVMVVGMSVLTDSFLTVLNITNLIKQMATNALLAFALTYCLTTGFIDLSVGSHVALAGCLAVTLINTGMPVPLAIIIVLCIGAVVGGTNGLIFAYSGMPAYVITLAMQNVLRGAAYLLNGGAAIDCNSRAFFSYANGKLFGIIPYPFLVVLAVGIILHLLMSKTVFGRHMYAVGGNQATAVYSGVNVKKIRFLVYTISGVLAALAGTITASRVYSGQPTVGIGFEGEAIAAAVLGGTSFTGGKGTIPCTVIGILVMGVMSNAMNLLEISYYWQLVVKGIVILIAVYADTVKRAKVK